MNSQSHRERDPLRSRTTLQAAYAAVIDTAADRETRRVLITLAMDECEQLLASSGPGEARPMILRAMSYLEEEREAL